MQTIQLTNPVLSSNIIFLMDNNRGYSIATDTGYATYWIADEGEDMIEDIVYAWLEYQTDIAYSAEDNYCGHRWWSAKYRPEERRKLLESRGLISDS